jgi:ferredoxin
MRQFVFLKWLRVAVSLSFFIPIFFLFIDFTNAFSSALIKGVLYFQFIPSIIKFVNLAGILTAGFIILLIITLLFGRVYCSSFCPLGTFQDIIDSISKRFIRKRGYKFSKSIDWLRYPILAISIICTLAGSLLMLNLLDPYSVFGKIVSDLFRPVYYGVNNLSVFVLEKTNLYTLYPVKLKAWNWISFGFSMFMLVLVVRFTLKKGRLYCNTVCPVGTLLGLISRISVFRIRLDEALCNSCGTCSAKCKSCCIDTKNKKVDCSRCVGCFNCLTVCPGNGVKFSFALSKPNQINAPIESHKILNRRQFLISSSSLSIGALTLANDSLSQVVKGAKIPVIKKYPVTPPGSLSIDHFHKNCTACHLCISACPTHVLQPSLLQYGWDGLFQPTMDYKASFCNFECIVCSEVCPTFAILPIAPEKKKLTQLGKTNFIKENCVVYTDETACGACSEHCPTKAVNMVFYKGKLNIPLVTQEICVGCGACEYACPTTPKSIYVEGNPVHLEAEKPKEIKSEIKVQPENDFPF